MATILPDASLDSHFFLKALKQKKDYQAKKLSKIELYKQKEKKDLLKDQLELLGKEEEIKQNINTIEQYRNIFIESYKKSQEGSANESIPREESQKAQSQQNDIDSLIKLYNSQFLIESAKTQIQDEDIQDQLENLQEQIKESFSQVFLLAGNIDQLINHQVYAKVFTQNKEQTLLLEQISQTLKEKNIQPAVFKKKHVEPKIEEQHIVVPAQQETAKVEEVAGQENIRIIPLPVEGEKKPYRNDHPKKKDYRNKKRFTDKGNKNENNQEHRDKSNKKIFQKKGEKGEHKRPSRVQKVESQQEQIVYYLQLL